MMMTFMRVGLIALAAVCVSGNVAAQTKAPSPSDTSPKTEASASGAAMAMPGGQAASKPLLSFDPGELVLLRKLAQRRQELDAREARLDERDQVIAALGAKLAEQMVELKRLQGELIEQEARMAAEARAEADVDIGRVKDLAKAYKAMKPKDAARLFDELDMALVAAIAREISPRVLAPVMARMSPKRARELTEALRES